MNDLIKVRKIVTHIENINHEGGPANTEPIKKGAILIVLENPYAGSYVEDITPMMEALNQLDLMWPTNSSNYLEEQIKFKVTERAQLSEKPENLNTAHSGMFREDMPCVRHWVVRWPSCLLPKSRRHRLSDGYSHYTHQCLLCTQSF